MRTAVVTVSVETEPSAAVSATVNLDLIEESPDLLHGVVADLVVALVDELESRS